MRNILEIFFVAYLLMLLMAAVKGEVVYHNSNKVLYAIRRYNCYKIEQATTLEELSTVSFIPYHSVKPYMKAVLNPFDWGYKRLVEPDILEKIMPFMEENSYDVQSRIRILKELRQKPISTIVEKPELVEESLNWAIKICEKYESKREVKSK